MISDRFMLYLGIGLVLLSLLVLMIVLIWGKIKSVRLEAVLNDEYGKPQR